MSTVQPAPQPSSPARPGTCRLLICINGDVYSLRSVAAPVKGGRIWQLRKRTGERSGAVYSVVKARGSFACTCPDWEHHQASIPGHQCKHIRAIVAAGLLSARPSRLRSLGRAVSTAAPVVAAAVAWLVPQVVFGLAVAAVLWASQPAATAAHPRHSAGGVAVVKGGAR